MKANGLSAAYARAVATDYIDVKQFHLDVFKVTGAFQWESGCLYAGYDKNYTALFTRCPAVSPSIAYIDEIVDVDSLIDEFPTL